jgi:thiamine-monophosphate kinase
MKKLSEFQLIDQLKRFQGRSPRVIKGIGDDAAVLELDARRYQLFTTDMIVEGVHFLKGAAPRAIGHKALACNISDIAAMGGVPSFAVVSIGIPRGLSAGYVQRIYAGMSALAKKFGVSIVGGDTVKSDRLVINIALLGEVEKKHLVLRSGARPGDRIFVTGPLGGSLKSGRHLAFIPRVREARFLVKNFKPTSMLDISDGLAGDLGHILKAGNVGAVIDADRVPLNQGADFAAALADGEDFELLFSLPSEKARKLIQCGHQRSGFRFCEIGEIIGSPKKLFVRDVDGRRRMIEPKGFTHF